MPPSGSPDNMKKALFYAFLAIFVATAAVTLLGITGVVAIDEFYLRGLFAALLLELVAVVIGLFRNWFIPVQKTVPKSPKASIDMPGSKQLVGRTINCSGSASGIQPPMHLWLYVEANGFVWPKEPEVVVDQDNQWAARVFEDGRSPEFAVALHVLPPEGDQAIREWLEDGKRTGGYAERTGFPGETRLARADGLRLG